VGHVQKAAASSPSLAKGERKNEPLPVFVVCRALMAAQREMAVRKTSKLIFAAAALAAAMGVNIPAGHAAGWRHEPWCAVFEYDDVTWDCSYRTFEDCYPNVIGGIRGSCSPNPDGPGASAATPAEAHKQRKQRAQQ
jgi:ribosomal protein L39E